MWILQENSYEVIYIYRERERERVILCVTWQELHLF